MGKVLILLMCGLVLWSCATNRTVGWTGADTLIVAEKLAAEVTQGPWLDEFSARHASSPVLVIAHGEDLSGASLPLNGIRSELVRQIMSSGLLRLVLSDEEYFEPAALAAESGADALVLWKVEADPRKKARLYWFDLRIVDAVDGTVLHTVRLAYPQPGYKSKRQTG